MLGLTSLILFLATFKLTDIRNDAPVADPAPALFENPGSAPARVPRKMSCGACEYGRAGYTKNDSIITTEDLRSQIRSFLVLKIKFRLLGPVVF